MAQSGANVLVVVNDASTVSRRIGEYYLRKRSVPLSNLCVIKTEVKEDVMRSVYEKEIEAPIAAFLRARQSSDPILYIATTLGVPLRVLGGGQFPNNENASVDSELTLLRSKMLGTKFPAAGFVPNPYFRGGMGRLDVKPFPIFLVTRLGGWDFEMVRAMIDRSLEAKNTGYFVVDIKQPDAPPGNDWLRNVARALPPNRVILDATAKPVYDQADVIGFASWGSNDPSRKRRNTGFHWLPGAVATEFVSTDGRTLEKPPEGWNVGLLFGGSSQSLATDFLAEGATAATAHVYEPFLQFTPRPDYLFAAYYNGRTLAESYYLAIPALSWQNIVLGDPLCRIGRAF